jgi:hypothetical protein
LQLGIRGLQTIKVGFFEVYFQFNADIPSQIILSGKIFWCLLRILTDLHRPAIPPNYSALTQAAFLFKCL